MIDCGDLLTEHNNVNTKGMSQNGKTGGRLISEEGPDVKQKKALELSSTHLKHNLTHGRQISCRTSQN